MLTMKDFTDFMKRNCLMIIYVGMLSPNIHSLTCPMDELSWKKRESIFLCESFVYHCGISVHGKEIEFCAVPMYIAKKFCPLFDITGHLNIYGQNCSGNGCPLNGYITNELYKYPSCINGSLYQNLSPNELTATENLLQNITRMLSTIDYDTTVSNSIVIHTTQVVQNGGCIYRLCFRTFAKKGLNVSMALVYSTNYAPEEIDHDKLITVSVVCGVSVALNLLITVCLIICTTCCKRNANDNGVSEQFEENRPMTAVKREEDAGYCEVGELVLLEGHGLEQEEKSKESNGFEVHLTMNNIGSECIHGKDNAKDALEGTCSNEDQTCKERMKGNTDRNGVQDRW